MGLRDLDDVALDEQLALRSARERLVEEFGSSLDEDTIDAFLDASWQHMSHVSRVKVHVPLLAERFARAQLWAAARMHADRPGVPAAVFVDTNDSGRGRMAKALFLRRAGAHGLESGISTMEAFPKPWTPAMLEAADVVVTFADGADVPVPDPARHRVWDVDDPRGRSADEVRAIRDRLSSLVDDLADELGIPDAD